jgi:hypothetical protein
MLLGASLATVKSPDDLPSREGVAAVAPRRYGLDPLHHGHHSMSGMGGQTDILDVILGLPFDTQLRRPITNATGVGPQGSKTAR